LLRRDILAAGARPVNESILSLTGTGSSQPEAALRLRLPGNKQTDPWHLQNTLDKDRALAQGTTTPIET
jgi:hypothetical protein